MYLGFIRGCTWSVFEVYPVYMMGVSGVSRPLTSISCRGLVASGYPVVTPGTPPGYVMNTPRYTHRYTLHCGAHIPHKACSYAVCHNMQEYVTGALPQNGLMCHIRGAPGVCIWCVSRVYLGVYLGVYPGCSLLNTGCIHGYIRLNPGCSLVVYPGDGVNRLAVCIKPSEGDRN